jgi:hypothetical protein
MSTPLLHQLAQHRDWAAGRGPRTPAELLRCLSIRATGEKPFRDGTAAKFTCADKENAFLVGQRASAIPT